MKKQYAFMLMGDQYDPSAHQCRFETDRDVVILRTVRNFDEAKAVVVELQNNGVGAIELCGAFGPELAKELAGATRNEVAIGYVVHDKSLDSLFERFFGK